MPSDAYIDVTLSDGTTKRAFVVSSTQAVQDFRKPEEVYVTLDNGETALLAVLFGTGMNLGVTMDHIFESVAARDAYFDAPDDHLDELIIGTPIIVQFGTPASPDVRIQIWAGENQPTSYPSPITNQWQDVTGTLTGDQVLILQTLNALTLGQIPKRGTSGFEASAMTEGTTEVVSTKRLQAPGFDVSQAVRQSSGVEEVCYSNLVRNTQSHPPLQRAEFDQEDRARQKVWAAAAVDDEVRQGVDTETLVNPSFDLTVDTGPGNADGLRIADLQVNFAAPATDATLIVTRSGATVFSHNFGSFAAGIQKLHLMRSPGQAGDPGFVDVMDGDTYTLQVMNASLLGNPANVPYYTLSFRSWNYSDLARVSDTIQEKVGIGSSITINNANLETYDKNLVYSTSASEIEITIAEGIDLNFFDLVVVGTAAVRVIASGAERINGETDVRFTNHEGGRIVKVDGNYHLIFDNTDPDMVDNYIDSVTVATNEIVFGYNSAAIPDISADLTEITLTEAFNYTPTGNQDIGVDLTSGVHNMGPNATSITILDGTTMRTKLFFLINVQGTADLTFNLATSGFTFAGIGSGTTNIIPGGGARLYWVLGTSIYPVAVDPSTGGASGDHPIVVTRDTPSLSTLAALAAASTNGNSALWVVASDQIAGNESGVDPSIMVRALESGFLDANGDELPTTAVLKNTIVLNGGSIVRIFSSTDLRVVSAPGSVAQEMRYPDVPFTGVVAINNEGTWNSFVGRTATNAGGANQYLVMPELRTGFRPSWVTPGAVFVMRHTGTSTGTSRPHFRPNNTGESIAGNGLRYWCDPGQTIAIQAPAIGIRTWQLFPVSQRSDGTSYYNPEGMSEFFYDTLETLSTRNPLSLYNRHDLNEGIVRDHIRTASFSANPISLAFQRKNYQDSIAWIQWWSVFAAVPPLGTIAEEILDNIPTSLAWIETNINNGYDFEFDAPDVTITIPAITNDGGNSFRIELSSALPSYLAVNDSITIVGATNPGNNGTFLIDSIAGDRLLFNITNASGVNESGTGAFTQKTIYCDAVLVSHDLRQTNFNCYDDSGRTDPANINPNWFNPDYEGGDSVLAIGYNTDVLTVPPALRMEDDNGDFFVELGGPRGQVFYFDNDGGEYQNVRYLPLNYEDIHIRTLGTANFYFDLHPEDLPPQQRRRYNIYSNLLNDNDDVTVSVGSPGNVITLDEGLSSLSILNGTNQAIEIYNDGTENGVRIVQPFEKYIPSASLTNVVTPSEGPIAMSIAEIVAAESQDPNFSFYGITGNKISCEGRFRYIFTMRITLRFDGAEDTGLSFVNVSLVPTRERNSVTTDITREIGNSKTKIDFVRNGNNSDDNTKPVYTLTGQLFYFAEPGDEIGWELRFGQFPAGYSVSDLRQIERQYTITVKGGIN